MAEGECFADLVVVVHIRSVSCLCLEEHSPGSGISVVAGTTHPISWSD